MSNRSPRLSDPDILARLLTRRHAARLGVSAAAASVASALGARRGPHRVLAQDGTPAAGEGTIYRPATPVGSPQPEVTGPAETPVGPAPAAATPAAAVSPEAFLDLSQALVGGGSLDARRGNQLLALIAADPARSAALNDLLAIRAFAGEGTPVATPVADLSPADRELVETILRFWYLGTYDDQPVEDRAGFWFGLSSWQAVQYTYAPSVCRAFGLWAEPPQIQA